MTRPRRLRAGPATAVLLGCLAVGPTACSDDEPDAGTATSSDPGSPSEPSTPATPSTTSPTSAPSPEPTVAPASGPLLRMPAVSVHLPDGWTRDDDLTSFLASGNNTSQQTMYLSQFPSLDPEVTPRGLEKATNTTSFQGKATVLDPVVVAGVEMRHLSGRLGANVDDAFVVLVDGDIVTITLSLDASLADAERRELVESVLASVAWR